MKNFIAIMGLLIISCGAGLAETASAPENGSPEPKKQYLYEWTDNRDTVHITDALGRVPEEYRSRARRIESVKGQEPDQQQMRGSSPSSFGNDNSDRGRAEWQSKISNWKSRLANAEARYRNLESERDAQFRAWGSAALAPIENRVRAEKIEQQMKDVQSEIEQAKHMLNEVIPEEARKAGVPPGWLRE